MYKRRQTNALGACLQVLKVFLWEYLTNDIRQLRPGFLKENILYSCYILFIFGENFGDNHLWPNTYLLLEVTRLSFFLY